MTEQTSHLVTESFLASSTGTEVEYKILVPNAIRAGQALPLILHFHGALSSAKSLEAAIPAYDLAWKKGELPPAIVACASTPTLGGFYIDHVGGPSWESLVSLDLPRHLANRYALLPQWAAIGASMGGYGALKVALRRPSNCVAVAALSPAIFPAETSERVPRRNLSSVLNDLNLAMGTDIATYASNSVYGILRNNLVSLSKVAPKIFIDCGEKDEFNLHDGAVYLHEALDRLSIPHTFKSIPGACHADEHTSARQETAIRFLGNALRAALLTN